MTLAQHSWGTFDKAIVKGVRPRIPSRCPASLRHLIEWCWKPRAKDRPDVDQILEALAVIERKYSTPIQEILETVPPQVKAFIADKDTRIAELEQELRLATEKSERLTAAVVAHDELKQKVERKLKKNRAKKAAYKNTVRELRSALSYFQQPQQLKIQQPKKPEIDSKKLQEMQLQQQQHSCQAPILQNSTKEIHEFANLMSHRAKERENRETEMAGDDHRERKGSRGSSSKGSRGSTKGGRDQGVSRGSRKDSAHALMCNDMQKKGKISVKSGSTNVHQLANELALMDITPQKKAGSALETNSDHLNNSENVDPQVLSPNWKRTA
eukprot:CAMPEP_0175128264 /NCGR_PEP_ID=MMETSP0087-20121206/4836_1 /TAXON_ID=136419 /ORGANISM="Unknown Unknown, Strain D1" /LENGTH=325 /DNA_ID=CAMNT_0016410315 /DNA_START=163 /DNA_END=1140 /DNA_ORIENTATION=+